MNGYRGFVREMARTGRAALWLQVSSGARHVLRRVLGGAERDPVALFLENYGPDGIGLPDPAWGELQLTAQHCLVCGLCSTECARVGGSPRLEPRDAVVSAARLRIDWARLQLAEPVGGACAGCSACDSVCPVGIPIHQVQAALGEPPRGLAG